MERVRGIGGVFFRASDPNRLTAWYAEHLGIEIADFSGTVFRASEGDATVWSVFRDETGYFGASDQQLMVNYRVENLDAMLAQLREAGVGVDDEVQQEGAGRFGWATDPEGNRFELWEPARAD